MTSGRNTAPEIVYLGRSHFFKSRANLIQTLHMVQAFERIGRRATLYLPARRGCNNAALQELDSFGVDRTLDVRFTGLLKSQWQIGLFLLRHQRELKDASIVFTRWPEISVRLGRAGVRHALEVHDIAEMRRKNQLNSIVRHHRRGVLTWLFPISAAVQAALIAEGADPARMHIAPSGVDIDAYANVPPLDLQDREKMRVVYLGRVTRDRGLDVLASLARSGEVEVTLVGDQDEQVEGPMRLVPFVPPCDVPQWYARCDLVLLPYQPNLAHADSISPIKLFEAMAAGRPIIASDLPAIREILRPGENGLLVTPADVSAWRSAVTSLRTHPDLAARLASQARSDVERYSWRKRAADILLRVESATQSKSSTRY